MNRRDFLSRFAQTAAGTALVHTLDVDKLLWVAGERTIFLPSAVAPFDQFWMPEFVSVDAWVYIFRDRFRGTTASMYPKQLRCSDTSIDKYHNALSGYNRVMLMPNVDDGWPMRYLFRGVPITGERERIAGTYGAIVRSDKPAWRSRS